MGPTTLARVLHAVLPETRRPERGEYPALLIATGARETGRPSTFCARQRRTTAIDRRVNLAELSRRVLVSDAMPERVAHARDLWPRSTLAMIGGAELAAPIAVAFPANDEEVAACLAWASSEGVPLVPWGAGSGVCGAAAGRGDAVALDLKRLRRIGPVDTKRQSVRVEAGVLGQHLEDALEAAGWATRHSPSSIWCSTVGGWAASRSAGQFSSKYGTFPDMVRGMRVVTPVGTETTGALASGPDLGPWFLGTEGSLGIITELEVRVVPFPQARWARGYRFDTVERAWTAMRGLLQAELHPAVVRLYDPVDTRIAGRGSARRQGADGGWLSDVLAALDGIPALRRNALTLPLALPGFVNALVRGISTGCVLVVAWEGDAEVVEVCARHGHAILVGEGVDLGGEMGEHWYAHRHDVSYKLAPIFAHGGFADTMEVAASWSRLPALYKDVRAALGRHALVMAHFSHVYREGCSIYFSFAGRGSLSVYDAAWADALAAAAHAGGTVAHHHGVGQAKCAAAAGELAVLAPAFRALKARLDPAGILNPGRLFPEVEIVETPMPTLGIDALSQCATLPAQESADERDAALAAQGWRLRFPTLRPLSESVRGDFPPWESPFLGASALVGGRRYAVPIVPRSAAGPDARRILPSENYETLTVPVTRLDEPSISVARWARDVRPLPDGQGGHALAGPAAEELSALVGP